MPDHWGAPKPGQSEWSKRPNSADQQKKYDEAELHKATYTEWSLFGGERKYDKDGKEIKNPSKTKHWWSSGLI